MNHRYALITRPKQSLFTLRTCVRCGQVCRQYSNNRSRYYRYPDGSWSQKSPVCEEGKISRRRELGREIDGMVEFLEHNALKSNAI